MIKKQKHRWKGFTHSNPAETILSPKLSMIYVQNEINSELNGSDYIKKLVFLANKDNL